MSRIKRICNYCGEIYFTWTSQNIKYCSSYCYHISRIGVKLSKKAIKNIRLAKIGAKNPNWKGDKIKSYEGLHSWVKNRVKKPKLCPHCKERPVHDLCNISHTYNPKTYTRDLKNWKWLCRKCHMIEDGRLEVLMGRKYFPKPCKNCKKIFIPTYKKNYYCSRYCYIQFRYYK